jgi:hypothetical protein
MQTKSLAIDYKSALLLVLLIGITVAAPICRNQVITGIIVNSMLFIGVSTLGTSGALLLGILPSSMALATGLLPSVLAPVIPFIIVGNTLLVISFSYVKRCNYWLGAIIASTLKFAFLFATSSIVISLLINRDVAPSIAQMMGWIQLVTAIGGSILAYGVTRFIKWQPR